jgi:Xaa-Pro aminopeptidase
MGGAPENNCALFWRVGFPAADPTAWIELESDDPNVPNRTIFILRDIEYDRARAAVPFDQVACPADFAPESGLSGDRETATAQSLAECLRRAGVKEAVADRSLPLVYADMVRKAGIALECDLDYAVVDRRAKTEQEIEAVRASQASTEIAIERACHTIATAKAGADGVLLLDGETLTAERVRTMIDVWLLEMGYHNRPSIVAPGKCGGDCHELGSGPIRTSEPVIVDVFPISNTTRFAGDSTRTVVHGDIPDEILRMHKAVRAAKAAGEAVCKAGATGETVHRATQSAIVSHGFELGLPPDDASETFCTMPHGTGHGVGLEVHEPPLLDIGGPVLLSGECVTIEPGLYSKALGGVRVEDIVVVRENGCESLNKLHEELQWD